MALSISGLLRLLIKEAFEEFVATSERASSRIRSPN
jgi:hypothetical protein